ncbi:DUF2254 family protein [Kitasatospora sp. NPDC059327]|uniref:DUF2254 family protein n=1 Tax=Kitasatospora sp. NPDC059327 TaxID=3346803 RepID=UPI0036C6038D
MRTRSALRRRRRVRAGGSQLLGLLAGLALGIVLPRITGGPMVPAGPVTELVLALGLGLLGAIALIFSLLFLVVQWAATTFTPRLTLFRDAPIVWRTFALTIGLVVFSLTAVVATGDRTEVSVAVLACELLLLLTLAVLLRSLQLRAFTAIQLAEVIASIAERGHAILDLLYPAATAATGGREGAGAAAEARSGPGSTVLWPHPPTVLQQIDIDRLLRVAGAADAVVVLPHAPGATLRRGAVVAEVRGGEMPAGAVLGALVTGKERTLEQDPTLALRLLADIALRALSPAVNDPATAVQVLDDLEDLLRRPAATAVAAVRVRDGRGAVRVVVRLPGWEEVLRSTVDDLVVASLASPMALDRMRALLRHLLAPAHADHRGPIVLRLGWLDEEEAARFARLRQQRAGP